MSTLTIKSPLVKASLLILLLAAVIVFITTDAVDYWRQLVKAAIGTQRELHRGLANAMRAVQASEQAAFWTLTGLGFLYGVFHAVGPGHGKVIISTYLATHESRLGRGIALSFLSSLAQGVTAIVLVGGLALVAERSLGQSQNLGAWLEILSYGLVVLIGIFLTVRGARRLVRARRHSAAAHHHCCHAHGPTSDQLERSLSMRELLLMILSIGIRPCSGAILVLVLAFAMQQLTAGVAAVAAMSIGTGLSISALAALTVYARKGVLALAEGFEAKSSMLGQYLDLAAILGGLIIASFGAALMKASFAVSQHPLL